MKLDERAEEFLKNVRGNYQIVRKELLNHDKRFKLTKYGLMPGRYVIDL